MLQPGDAAAAVNAADDETAAAPGEGKGGGHKAEAGRAQPRRLQLLAAAVADGDRACARWGHTTDTSRNARQHLGGKGAPGDGRGAERCDREGLRTLARRRVRRRRPTLRRAGRAGRSVAHSSKLCTPPCGCLTKGWIVSRLGGLK